MNNLRNRLDELCKKTYNDLRTDDDRNDFLNEFKAITAPYVDRLNLDAVDFIHRCNFNVPVIHRRLLPYCSYIDGNYVGSVYVDTYGHIYETLQEVQNVYKENYVLTCKDNHDMVAYANCAYIEDLDCVLVGWIQCRFSYPPSHINDVNSHLDRVYRAPAYYGIITKDMKWVATGSPAAPINNCYYGYNGKINNLMSEMKKLLNLPVGVVNVGGNKYIPLDCLSNIGIFSTYKAKLAHKSGKVQNKIDELVAMKEFDTAPMADRMPHEYENLICKTNINKINDNLCVIRWTYNYLDESFDGMRVYIEGNDVYACKRNNAGQFVKVALSTLNQKNFASEYESELVFDDMSGTRLEWYKTIIDRIPQEFRTTLLMMFLTDVKMEQLVKLGFAPSICQVMVNCPLNIGNVLRSQLKVVEEAEDKNVLRWLGMNKHQLNAILEYCKDTENDEPNSSVITTIAAIKDLFNRNDISSYDDAIFDEWLATYTDHGTHSNTYYYRGYWGCVATNDIRNLLQIAADNDESGVFENNLMRYMAGFMTMCQWGRGEFNKYYDFINMVCKMNIRQQVRLYPNDLDDLTQMHDNAVRIYNMQKDAYQRAEFIKRMADLEKYKYENEEFEFCVEVPKVPEDLAVEGLTLRHCVKSYIDRVCNGRTNVLFIRRKDERNKPFFTVELTNDRVIAQVHGFSNRNVDTEPQMLEFVHRWARNKRLTVGSINSVRG